MPIEYYAGAAIALIVVVLLVLLMKPGRSTRQSAQHNSINADQLAKQLSRIADSLEILVARMGAAATVEKPRAEGLSAVGLRGEDPKPLAKEPPAEVPKAHVEEPRAEEVKPPAEKAPASPPNAVEPSAADPGKVEQPVERHVRLSMFGR
jgi:hypothetical protein